MDPSEEKQSIYGVWIEGDDVLCVLTRRLEHPLVKKIVANLEYEKRGTSCEGIITWFKLTK